MTLLVPLAFAFAAFCVWLTVRIINRRERWAKWTAVAAIGAIGLPVLYAASIGPMTWLAIRGFVSHSLFSVVYEPLDIVENIAPPVVAYPLNRWIDLSYKLVGITPDKGGAVLIDRTAK